MIEGVESLPCGCGHNSLLQDIARKFISVGMCEEAVEAFLKANQVKDAIDSCVALNQVLSTSLLSLPSSSSPPAPPMQWDLAVQLAKQHSIKEVNSLLVKYAAHLLENETVLNAIELYPPPENCISLLTTSPQYAPVLYALCSLSRLPSYPSCTLSLSLPLALCTLSPLALSLSLPLALCTLSPLALSLSLPLALWFLDSPPYSYRKANNFLEAAKLLVKVRQFEWAFFIMTRYTFPVGSQGGELAKTQSSQGEEDLRAGCYPGERRKLGRGG